MPGSKSSRSSPGGLGLDAQPPARKHDRSAWENHEPSRLRPDHPPQKPKRPMGHLPRRQSAHARAELILLPPAKLIRPALRRISAKPRLAADRAARVLRQIPPGLFAIIRFHSPPLIRQIRSLHTFD